MLGTAPCPGQPAASWTAPPLSRLPRRQPMRRFDGGQQTMSLIKDDLINYVQTELNAGEDIAGDTELFSSGIMKPATFTRLPFRAFTAGGNTGFERI